MNHLKKIQEALRSQGKEALLITSEANEFYAVGFKGEGWTLITPDQVFYATDSRYIEAAGRIEGIRPECMSRERSHRTIMADHVRELGIKTLDIEENAMTVSLFRSLKEALPEEVSLENGSDLLTELRAAKDEAEIALMKEAQAITDRTFSAILKELKVGMTEKEVAARLTYLQMSFGAEKNSFDPIAASGPNSSMPHAVPTDRRIEEGDLLTMDFGCLYKGYCSDMTRTVCFGQPTEEMKRVYETVKTAQETAISRIRAGVIGADIHRAAEEVIERVGYGGCFGHGFGHSLGIEIHERPTAAPSNKEPVPENAVISAEPGIYLPGRFGVRIEDVTIYRANGAEDITASPKDLICL